MTRRPGGGARTGRRSHRRSGRAAARGCPPRRARSTWLGELAGEVVARARTRAHRAPSRRGRRRPSRSTCGPRRTAPGRSARQSVDDVPKWSLTASSVAFGSGSSSAIAAERGLDLRHVGTVQRLDRGERQAALGDRPGLVGAQHVDAGQHLDRRQLLHEAALLAQPDHADGEGHAGEQHESLGDHPDEAGDGGDDRVLPALVAAQELARGEQQADRDDRVADDGDDPVDVVAQRRVDQREALGLLGQLRRVVVGADLGDPHVPGAGDDGAAGQHLVAGGLDDGVGLAGEQRLVDLQAVLVEHLTVGDDLLAGAQLDDVVEDEVADGQLLHLAVAHHVDDRCVDHAQGVEHLLGAQLLDDADDAVGDDHPAEQGVLRRAGEDHERGEDRHDQVDGGEDVGRGRSGGRCASAPPGSC